MNCPIDPSVMPYFAYTCELVVSGCFVTNETLANGTGASIPPFLPQSPFVSPFPISRNPSQVCKLKCCHNNQSALAFCGRRELQSLNLARHVNYG